MTPTYTDEQLAEAYDAGAVAYGEASAAGYSRGTCVRAGNIAAASVLGCDEDTASELMRDVGEAA